MPRRCLIPLARLCFIVCSSCAACLSAIRLFWHFHGQLAPWLPNWPCHPCGQSAQNIRESARLFSSPIIYPSSLGIARKIFNYFQDQRRLDGKAPLCDFGRTTGLHAATDFRLARVLNWTLTRQPFYFLGDLLRCHKPPRSIGICQWGIRIPKVKPLAVFSKSGDYPGGFRPNTTSGFELISVNRRI